MSKTFKDLGGKPNDRTTLEVVKNDDGTYDLLANGELAHSHSQERWLNQELCDRYGFCGEECDAIVHRVNSLGRASIVF